MGYNIYFLLTMGILESKIKTIKLHKKSFKLTVSNEYWQYSEDIKPITTGNS